MARKRRCPAVPLRPAAVVRALSDSPGYIVIKDTELRVIWASRFDYGWTPETTLGRPIHDRVAAFGRNAWTATLRRVLETGDTVQGVVVLLAPAGGPPLPMPFRASRWASGVVVWCWDASGDRAEESERLTPTQRAALAAATREPVTGQVLAARAGVKYHSRFRSALSDLVDLGFLRRVSRGYCLP